MEPEWAEALNSALDDNRLLTLPNGIGIKLGSATRYIYIYIYIALIESHSYTISNMYFVEFRFFEHFLYKIINRFF